MMTARYLRPEEKQLERKFITIRNLKKILRHFTPECIITASDLGNLLVNQDGVYLGVIEMLDGKGEFSSYKGVIKEAESA